MGRTRTIPRRRQSLVDGLILKYLMGIGHGQTIQIIAVAAHIETEVTPPHGTILIPTGTLTMVRVIGRDTIASVRRFLQTRPTEVIVALFGYLSHLVLVHLSL